jgi:hypothetical protein
MTQPRRPLTADLLQRGEDLLHELLDRDEATRDAVLPATETEDPELAAFVRGLLQADVASLPTVDDWLEELGFGEEPEELGGYRVVEKLGEGGMAAVYLCHDARLDRDIAIKVPEAHLEGDLALEESRAFSKSNHPNVAIVHELVTYQGRLCPVMEYLPGGTLRARLDAGELSPEDVDGIMKGILNGLAAIHSKDLVHGDIKPENIGFDQLGTAKILDFGIARPLRSDDAPDVTRRTIGWGTPAYMAPERRSGGGRSVAADLWAAGAVLGEMLRKAEECRGDDRLKVWLEEEMRLTAHRPERRPASAGEVLDRVRQRQEGARARRRKMISSAGLVRVGAVVALVVVGAFVGSAMVPGFEEYRTTFDEPIDLAHPGPFRVLHPDPEVFPEQSAGELRLTTNFGDVQYDHTQCPNDRPPRNMLLLPITGTERFSVTAVIDSFWPTENWQQAGIVVAGDESMKDCIRLAVGSYNGVHQVHSMYQTNNEPRFKGTTLGNAHVEPIEGRVIRLVRDGAVWRCETRRVADSGWDLVSSSEVLDVDFEPRFVALVAMNGFECEGEWPNRLPKFVPPVDVVFDSFRVERYPPTS